MILSSKSTTPQTLQEIMNTSYEFRVYHVDANVLLCVCVWTLKIKT